MREREFGPREPDTLSVRPRPKPILIPSPPQPAVEISPLRPRVPCPAPVVVPMISLQIAPPSLSSLPTSALYDILQPIIATPHARFYNWSRTFSCAPLITFEPSNVEECRLVFELAHREQRTVRIVGAGLSPSDVACTSEFMLRTHRMNKLRAVRDRARPVPALL